MASRKNVGPPVGPRALPRHAGHELLRLGVQEHELLRPGAEGRDLQGPALERAMSILAFVFLFSSRSAARPLSSARPCQASRRAGRALPRASDGPRPRRPRWIPGATAPGTPGRGRHAGPSRRVPFSATHVKFRDLIAHPIGGAPRCGTPASVTLRKRGIPFQAQRGGQWSSLWARFAPAPVPGATRRAMALAVDAFRTGAP